MSGPERIFIFPETTHSVRLVACEVEYIRADLHETVVRERDQAVSDYHDAKLAFQKTLIERDALRALLDEAQRDAARYKWLRDVWWLGDDYFDTPEPMTCTQTADEFDAAIDEARIPRVGG